MKLKLLIVDDDTLIRETYQSALSIAGYDVDVAGDLPTIERILKHSSPDYLLLDLMMKPKSGWEILEHLKQNPGSQNIPIIIFSGKAIFVHEIRRYGGQVIGYIRKPARLPDIIREISRVSSCQKEALLFRQKAVSSGFSDEDLNECISLTLNIPVLDKLTFALQQNFKYYAGDGKNSGQVLDPDLKELLSWIEEKKVSYEKLTKRIK